MRRIALLEADGSRARVLALGAHPDDIEIGCGGTLLRLVAECDELEVLWVVFAATPARAEEARGAAGAFLEGVAHAQVIIHDFPDGFLPYHGAAVKDAFETLKHAFSPDVIFTHFRDDRHQDHRLISDLTWNTWRDHLILEYEIPKYDGDLGSPNLFCAMPQRVLERKIALLIDHFASQAGRAWFTPELFRSLARLRGMEAASSDGYAEGFYCRKACF